MTTHDSTLRLAGQMVAAGATDEEVLAVVSGLLPTDYAGNSIKELPAMINSARAKGFDRGGHTLPLDESVARDLAEGSAPLAYVHGDGFLRYGDGYWAQISDRDIDRRAKDLLLPHVTKGKQVAAYLKNARVCTLLNVERVGFGANATHLCLRNGTLDVLTAKLGAHSPDYELRFQLPFDYDPRATCPLYEQHVTWTFAGDEKKIALFDEFAGLTLVPDMGFQKAVYLVGKGGSGKSSLLRLLRAMHDPSAISVTPLDKINEERYLTDLARKLLCISFDIQTEKKVFGEAFIRITGGDPVAVRRLYQEVQGMVTPTVRFLGSMNPDMPRFSGAPDALIRRLIFLECNEPVEEPRKDHEDRLREELPGILVRWVRALRRLNDRGCFDIPESSLIAVKAYLFEEEPFDTFFTECLIIDNNVRTPISAIHAAFDDWARSNGEATLTANVIGRKLRRLGVKGGYMRHASAEESRTVRTVGVTIRTARSESRF